MTHEELLEQINTAQKQGNYDIAFTLAEELATATEKTPGSEEIHAEALCKACDALRFAHRRNEGLIKAETALVFSRKNRLKKSEAFILNTIGAIYTGYDNAHAESYLQQALALEYELGNFERVAGVLNNLARLKEGTPEAAIAIYRQALEALPESSTTHFRGTIIKNLAKNYLELNQFEIAIEYYYHAIEFFTKIGHSYLATTTLESIAEIYYSRGEHQKALALFTDCLSEARAYSMKSTMVECLIVSGHCHNELGNYDKALEFYQEAIASSTEFPSIPLQARSGIASIEFRRGNYRYAEKLYQQILIDFKEERTLVSLVPLIQYMYANSIAKQGRFKEAKVLIEEAIEAGNNFFSPMERVSVLQVLSEIQEEERDFESLATTLKQQIDLLQQIQKDKSTELLDQRRIDARIAQREQEIAIARAIDDAKHQATEHLLHNVLPPTIARKMLGGTTLIAEKLPNVSVLFADIVNFTNLSQHITPEELVEGLDSIFSSFDSLAEKYGVEKIKTIGDAYMVVSGAPEPREDHAMTMALFALDIAETLKEFRSKTTGENIQLRIGIHSGEVVAGVLGRKKFAYDLWGDTVNTASRMESHGEAGKIHVSQEFINELTTKCEKLTIDHDGRTLFTLSSLLFTAIPRGEVDIKGKGRMRTFFLERA